MKELHRIMSRSRNRQFRRFERHRDALNGIGYIMGLGLTAFGIWGITSTSYNLGGFIALAFVVVIGLHTFTGAVRFSGRKRMGRLPER